MNDDVLQISSAVLMCNQHIQESGRLQYDAERTKLKTENQVVRQTSCAQVQTDNLF